MSDTPSASIASVASGLPGVLRFGTPQAPARFELQAAERCLLVDGVPAALGGRAFDLLLVLVERGGSLVGKHELLDRVWPGLVVEEANLSVQVSSLRKVLGPDVIATIPGRGYRFVARLAEPPFAGPAVAAAAPRVPETAAEPARSRTNLPGVLLPMLGREDALAALQAMIAGHRLVSIVGAGGMGKTLLVQHLLKGQLPHWRDGACFVDLAPVASAQDLPAAVAAALGVKLGAGPGGDASASLAQAVAPLHLLMALDNAEHLVEAVARLATALLDRAPSLSLVATSQVPLRLPTERVVRLAALAVPGGPLPAAQARAFGAVALFEERARAADGRFALSDANAPRVTALVQALDGVPLAIELAAARVGSLGLERVAAAMQDRLQLLTRPAHRLAPARQHTLRAALVWSHGLLSPTAQAVFRRLAALPAPAPLGAVLAVAADPEPPSPLPGPVTARLGATDVLDALDELVELSLVALVLPGDGDGPHAGAGPSEEEASPRYRLLESPAALAREHLQAAGETETLRQRHARWCTQWVRHLEADAPELALAGREEPLPAGGSGLVPVARTWVADETPAAVLLREQDHVRAALGWALAHDAMALVLDLLPWALAASSRHAAAETLRLADLASALAARTAQGSAPRLRLAAARCLTRACTVITNLRPARSFALVQQGLALLEQDAGCSEAGDDGDDDRAGPGLPATDRLRRRLSFRLLLQHAQGCAWLPQAETASSQAEASLQRAAGLLQPHWPPLYHALLHDARAFVARYRGDSEEALAAYTLARARLPQGSAFRNGVEASMVDLLLLLNRHALAREIGRAQLRAMAGTRDAGMLSLVRLNLAQAHLALDEPADARALASEAWRTAPFLAHDAWWTDVLALLLALEGRPADAARLAGHADAAYRAHDDLRQAGEAASLTRALALAAAALGEAKVAALRTQGEAEWAAGGSMAVEALAFGSRAG